MKLLNIKRTWNTNSNIREIHEKVDNINIDQEEMARNQCNGTTHLPVPQTDNDDETDTNMDGNDEHRHTRCCKCLCLKRLSNIIVWGLETAFYKLGRLVAIHPIKTIVSCILVCGIAGIGIVRFREEKEYLKCWLPHNSRIIEEHHWIQQHFPESTRVESIIVEDKNVLSPKSLQAMFDLYEWSHNFTVMKNHSLDTLCIKAGPICRVSSLLELWSYNGETIRGLTQQDIYITINQDKIISPMYGNEINLEQILGQITRDSSSKIVGAKATTMFWFLERNNKTHDAALDWEKMLIDTATQDDHEELENVYIYTARSFDDEALDTLTKEMYLFVIGFGLVFLYLAFSIGKYSCIQQKIYLAIGGLLSIGLAMVFTYGIGLGAGIMFGPIHQILPFLLLGIGVDDIFVIIESFKHLTPKEQDLPIEERMALTLKHAGVSITVTSITDIVAFAIGSLTVIPGLSTFCMYASLGVLALYVLQATYFVACLTLDERRIEAKKNACITCYKHEDDYKENTHNDFNLMHLFMKKVWGPLVIKVPVKVLVILLAIGISSLNSWSITQTKLEFDNSIYLPTLSYTKRFVDADRKYFPGAGAFVTMYCGSLDYENNIYQLLKLIDEIKRRPNVQKATVHFWLADFNDWLGATNTVHTQSSSNSSDMKYHGIDFYKKLGQFLHTSEGMMFLSYLKLDNFTFPMNIKSSIVKFRQVKCASTQCNMGVMDDLRQLVDNYKFNGGGKCFVYSDPQYFFNDTNKVLKFEIFRNLAIAAVCVFVVTLILIANLWTSLLVFICVVLTVVNVTGMMHFLNISIDTCSGVILILCFGLAVDYSAHIGHCFMTVSGTRNERVKKTLVTIGPAVFSGGFSTFLAFLPLANSVSYGYIIFFMVFTSVVISGLFHGLVLLPVLLSLVGPAPYEANAILNTITTVTSGYNAVVYTHNGHATNVHDNVGNGKLGNGVEHTIGELCKEDDCANIETDTLENESGDQDNPRYSGSYYEQLSSGSLAEIPNLGLLLANARETDIL